MTREQQLTLQIQSETGELEAVLLHYPGAEVENMTPRHAQRALYSDILNLSIARKEYNQLLGVLQNIQGLRSIRFTYRFTGKGCL